MTLAILEADEAAERIYAPAYAAVVIDNGTIILDDSFEYRSERTNAIARAMLDRHDELSHAEVTGILTPFGGADADVALEHLMDRYASRGVQVHVHLSEHQRDIGPAVFYSVFIDFGDGTSTIEHYSSREARLSDLRSRAADASDQPLAYYASADEDTCTRIISHALGGRVHLMDARRRGVEEIYSGHEPKE